MKDFEQDLEEDDSEVILEPDIIEPVEEKKEKKNMRNGILTESQIAFAREVASGARLNDAYRKAYPRARESKLVDNYAWRLVRNPKVRQEIETLQHAARMQFIIDSPRAAQKLIDLSTNAKSEKIQLEATKDILNRGGLQPPQRVETVAIGIFGSASQEDIRQLLRKQIENKEEEDKE